MPPILRVSENYLSENAYFSLRVLPHAVYNLPLLIRQFVLDSCYSLHTACLSYPVRYTQHFVIMCSFPQGYVRSSSVVPRGPGIPPPIGEVEEEVIRAADLRLVCIVAI